MSRGIIRLTSIILLATVFITGCGTADDSSESAAGNDRPTVRIESPTHGDRLSLGDTVDIIWTATDSQGITRTDLQINGLLERTDSTPNPDGQRSYSLVHRWTPSEPGSYVITVIAYRVDGTDSDPAQVSVTVIDPNATPTPDRQATQQAGATVDAQATSAADPANACRANANIDLNVRAGPSIDYNQIGVLGQGKSALVIGRDDARTWWQIDYPSAPDGVGWLYGPYISLSGDCDDVKVGSYTPPPDPPDNPTPTVEDDGRRPDLIVAAIDMPNAFQIPIDGSGRTVTINVTVANVGRADAEGVFSIIMFPTGRGGLGGQISLGTLEFLPAGESLQLSNEYTYIIDGTFKAEFEIDPLNIINESDETNNVRSVTITVIEPTRTPTPDK